MNRLKYISSLFVLLLASTLSAQAQNKVLTSIGKAGQTYLKMVSGENVIDFSTAGGSKSIEISTNTAVSAKSAASWCKTEMSGATITITAGENTESATRETEVSLNALDGNEIKLTVRQLGTSPDFLLRETEVNVNGQSCRVLLNITSNSELAFTLPEWISEVDASPTEGSKTYIFTTGNLDRTGSQSGEITVATKADASNARKVKVTQTFEGYPHFIVMSDLHFGGGNATERVTRSLENLFAADPEIEAIIVNGDITNNGAPEQYSEFQALFDSDQILPEYVERHYVMGNHEWFVGDNALENYQALGHEHNKYFEIKGYPFIYAGMSGPNEQDYSEESYDFLRRSLKDANIRYAGKPIFVFTHIPVYGTTHGSTANDGEWGNKTFKSIFDEYPQIIHFCGHTHFSLRDPKALWQGEFTSVDDGSNYYCYLTPGIDADGSTPDGTSNVQEGIVVSVDDLTNVSIRRFDSRRNEEILPAWDIHAPYDGTNMPYASYTGGDAPFFMDSEVTTEEGQPDMRKVTFRQASDDDVVLYYKVSVKNADGEEVGSANRCSSFYLGSEMPETRTITLKGLPSGDNMYAEVVAYDPYGNASEPIKSEPFNLGTYTPAAGVTAPEPDILDFVINSNGEPTDATNTFKIEKGSVEPIPFYCSTYKRNAAQFQKDKQQYYKADYSQNSEVIEAIQNEITFESLFCCNTIDGGRTPLSSMQKGGIGIELDDGLITLYVRINNEWKVVSSDVYAKPGYYYHVVGTYSKSENKICVYVNGYPGGTMDVEGEFTMPNNEKAWWFGIGADASPNNDSNTPMDGQVVVARVYSKAVSRDEVYCMFKIYDDIAKSSSEDEDPVDVAPEADLMNIVFGENGTATDISPVATEVLTGKIVPVTYYNETYQRWVAKFTGSETEEYYSVPYGKSGTIYDAMGNSFSLEALAVVNNAGSNLPAVVSSQQNGGFGIEPGEDIQVWGHFAGQYATVYTGIEVEKDRFYHIVAVYDADESEMRVYVDGALAGRTAVAGYMDYPTENAQYFCIGGDACWQGSGAEYLMEGEVALVRMYSHAISLGEAKKLYNDIQAVSAGE